jgi:hypothetical protein
VSERALYESQTRGRGCRHLMCRNAVLPNPASNALAPTPTSLGNSHLTGCECAAQAVDGPRDVADAIGDNVRVSTQAAAAQLFRSGIPSAALGTAPS